MIQAVRLESHFRSSRSVIGGSVGRTRPTTSGGLGSLFDLESVEDWLRQEKVGGDRMIGPTTFFVPMNRVLRIDLDESTVAVEGYADRYRTACGRDVRDALIDNFGSDA